MKNLQRNALKLAIYENPTLKFFFTCYFILLYHTLKIYLPKNGNAGIHYYLAATLFSYSFFSFVRSWEKANFQGWMTFSRSSRSSYFVRNFESNYTLHRQKEVKSINWKKPVGDMYKQRSCNIILFAFSCEFFGRIIIMLKQFFFLSIL